MAKKPVTVICDFTGTFNDGWTGVQPAWTVTPESLKCHKGNHVITWSLTVENVPDGFDAALTDPGVVFKPTPTWPGGTPQNKPDGTVTATNDVHAGSKKATYRYTTFATATPKPGTPYPGQTFSYDPDVENDSGGGKDDGKPAKRTKTRRTAKPKAKARPKAKAKKTTKKTARKTAKKKAGKKR